MAFEDIGWHLILAFEDIGANSLEDLKTSNSSGSRGTWGIIGMTPTYFCIYFIRHVTLLFSKILNNTWIDALHLLISLDNLKHFQSFSIYTTVMGVDFTIPNEGNSWNIFHEAQPSEKYFNSCPSLVLWNPRPMTVVYIVYTTPFQAL